MSGFTNPICYAGATGTITSNAASGGSGTGYQYSVLNNAASRIQYSYH